MICITMMAITATLVCKFKCCFTNDHFENTTDYPYKEYFLIFFAESADINSIAKRCYYLVDLACASMFSIILIARQNDSNDCTPNAIGMLVLSIVYFLYIIIIKPFRELIDTIINITNSLIQIVLTVLMILLMAGHDVSYYISIINFAINVQYICGLIIPIAKWVKKRYRVKKNNPHTGLQILIINSDPDLIIDLPPAMETEIDDLEIINEVDMTTMNINSSEQNLQDSFRTTSISSFDNIDATINHKKQESIHSLMSQNEMVGEYVDINSCDTSQELNAQPEITNNGNDECEYGAVNNSECTDTDENIKMPSVHVAQMQNDYVPLAIKKNISNIDGFSNVAENTDIISQLLTIKLNLNNSERIKPREITRDELEKFVYS